eukprot:gene367-biopygen6103
MAQQRAVAGQERLRIAQQPLRALEPAGLVQPSAVRIRLPLMIAQRALWSVQLLALVVTARPVPARPLLLALLQLQPPAAQLVPLVAAAPVHRNAPGFPCRVSGRRSRPDVQHRDELLLPEQQLGCLSDDAPQGASGARDGHGQHAAAGLDRRRQHAATVADEERALQRARPLAQLQRQQQPRAQRARHLPGGHTETLALAAGHVRRTDDPPALRPQRLPRRARGERRHRTPEVVLEGRLAREAGQRRALQPLPQLRHPVTHRPPTRAAVVLRYSSDDNGQALLRCQHPMVFQSPSDKNSVHLVYANRTLRIEESVSPDTRWKGRLLPAPPVAFARLERARGGSHRGAKCENPVELLLKWRK